MTQAEAEFIVSKLLAAYPSFRDHDQLTAAVYVEQLVKLPDGQIAMQAVNDLIAAERWMPTVADIREGYNRAVEARRLRVKALNEPAPTAEELEEGRRIGLEFLARMEAGRARALAETDADIEAKRARAASL